MGEQDALEALGVLGEWLWGDDSETTVFAQAFGHGKTSIFRFKRDETQRSPSLAARIVNCYHDLTGSDPSASFTNRFEMRAAIWSAVASVWAECDRNPSTKDPDVIIDIYDLESCSICHENLFNDYLNLLLRSDQLSLRQPLDTMDFKELIRENQLGGRGCTTLVHTTLNPEPRFVFKGIDFRTFLNSYESGHIREEVKIFYRSVELISNMSHHPNIMAAPRSLVTIQNPGDNVALVCGTLYPFFSGGTVASQIENYNKYGQRIPLSCKAQWCYQMTAAIAHTCLVAHTYHMDIKPGNFLIDNDANLILIDWEQSDAPVSTAAPEIDGTWDVTQSSDSSGSLLYTKYTGPERRNMPTTTPGNSGWNVWNVFPIWSEQCPKAVELAETFSLGRSMWMLLRQPDMEAFNDVASTLEIVEDWSFCEDIPSLWKQKVEMCLERNPNERINLYELLAFWDKERLKLA